MALFRELRMCHNIFVDGILPEQCKTSFKYASFLGLHHMLPSFIVIRLCTRSLLLKCVKWVGKKQQGIEQVEGTLNFAFSISHLIIESKSGPQSQMRWSWFSVKTLHSSHNTWHPWPNGISLIYSWKNACNSGFWIGVSITYSVEDLVCFSTSR